MQGFPSKRIARGESARLPGDWQGAAADGLRLAAQLMREAGTASRESLQRMADRLGSSPTTGQPDLARPQAIAHAADTHEERARAFELRASQRIDAALHELEQLRQELSAVIDPALLARSGRIATDGLRPPERTQAAPSVTAGRGTGARSAA